MGSSVTHYEMQGYPQDSGNEKEFTAMRQVVCAWGSRHTLMADYIGPPGDLYPYWTTVGARCIGASCVPFPGNRQVGASSAMATYEQAVVTLNYSTNCPESTDLISESLEPTVEFQPLDYARFQWGSGAGDALMPAEAPGRMTKGLNYVVTFHHLTTIPASFLSLIECCNASAVTAQLLGLTFPAETLLFNPPTLSRKISTTGADAWTATCRFTYRPSTWNKFWRAKTQQYEAIYPCGGSTAYKNIPTGDFSAIFG